jgi:methionyl-tRNA formyltransferase
LAAVKLLLCAFGPAGRSVFEHVLAREDIADVALFTHEDDGTAGELRVAAEGAGVYCTTDDISSAPLPFAPDVVSSVYYRKIISSEVINACDGRIFNAHPSLLPRHRGCSSVPWAIIEGDDVTGVTYHYIDAGIDTGPVILQSVLQIRPDENQATLYERCRRRVVELWPPAFALVEAGFPGVSQEGDACYHPRGAPHAGTIGEEWELEKVERFIRAMTFPPYPYATFRGVEVRTLDDYVALRAGDVVHPRASRQDSST